MKKAGSDRTVTYKITKKTRTVRFVSFPDYLKKGIVIESIDNISKRIIYIITCQKCRKKWKVKNIKKLPKTCIKCKRDPFTGPGKRGRPKK